METQQENMQINKESKTMKIKFENLTMKEINRLLERYIISTSGRMIENNPSIKELEKFWVEELMEQKWNVKIAMIK